MLPIRWPSNLWVGTSITSARYLDRIDHLREVGDAGTIRFLSIEPQYEPISVKDHLDGIRWVIQGGESGPTKGEADLIRLRGARPFDIEWARQIRDECHAARVPYFLKQLGSAPEQGGERIKLPDRHGGDWDEWPSDLRVRMLPAPSSDAVGNESRSNPTQRVRVRAADGLDDEAVMETSQRSAAADFPEWQRENRRLYEDGCRYLEELPPGTDSECDTAVLKALAREHDTGVPDVRTAILLVEAVHGIVHVAGPWTKEVLLSGENVMLTPVLIGELHADLCTVAPKVKVPAKKISAAIKTGLKANVTPAAKKTAARLQRNVTEIIQAMRQAAQGLHPLAPPVPAGVSSKLAVWNYDVQRLQRARRLLDDGISAAQARSLTMKQRGMIYRDALSIRVATSALLLALEVEPEDQLRPKSITIESSLLRRRRSARLLVAQVTHDLPLVITQQPPSKPARDRLGGAVKDAQLLAKRLAAITRPATRGRRDLSRPLVYEAPPGSDSTPGTYVFVRELQHDAVLRVGRLGTFRLPKGFLLYVGSAMGSGGVGGRTGHHRKQDPVNRIWNEDYLKGTGHAIERWWTASRVECEWAMALAEVPGVCCPAPDFGAHCPNRCPAHLYHTSERPTCEAFAEVAYQAIPKLRQIFRSLEPELVADPG